MHIHRIIISLLIMAAGLLHPYSLSAQSDSSSAATAPLSDTTKVRTDTTDLSTQMDLIELTKKLFKKKSKVDQPDKPAKIRKDGGPYFTIIPYPNYTIATGVSGVLTTNIAFYVNKKERDNQSFFNNQVQYTQYKQLLTQSISNVYFHHDKWELLGDWRYINFPTYTYGLGIHTTTENEDQLDYSWVKLYETLVRRVGKYISVGGGYQLDYHWNMKDHAADSGTITDLVKYGYTDKSISSGLTANFMMDSRDNVNNPMKGSFLNIQFRANLKILGSTNNWNSFLVDYRRYFPMPTRHWKSTLAVWTYMVFTVNGNAPYLDLPSTGADTYNNTGRSYALGRFRGIHMLYLEAEYRFQITKNGLLGGVVFSNLQSFADWPNINFTGVQPGIGLGLRVKVNKRTNTNIAADYGFGTKGSKGAAFNLNEVF